MPISDVHGPDEFPDPPCKFCKSTTTTRSACPGCGKVICRACAEKPYATCCDDEDGYREINSCAQPLNAGTARRARSAKAPQ